MFLKVLNETGHLCYSIESDALLVYELLDAISDMLDNLNDVKEDKDESEFLPPNNKISETTKSENFLLANAMKGEAEGSNISISKLQKLSNMSERQRLEAEKSITCKTNTFFLNNINEGKEKID